MAITKFSNSTLKTPNRYNDFLAGNTAYDPPMIMLETNTASGGQTIGQSLGVDSSGNVYAAGNNTSTGYYWKFDSSLNNTFQKQLQANNVGTSGGGYFGKLANNNFYITARGAIGGIYYGRTLKIDSAGAISWQRYIGQGFATQPKAIDVDGSDNVYVCGTNRTSTGGANDDAYVIKYNSSGTLQWQRFFGNASVSSSGTGLAVTSSGDVYISGSDATSGAFIAKYNTSGTIQWQRTFGGSKGFQGVSLDSSGNIYAVGYDGATSPASAYLLKIDSSGTITWQRKLSHGTNGLYFDSSSVDSNGDVYVLGSTFPTTNLLLLVKYNSSGTIQWQRTVQGLNNTVYVAGCNAISIATSNFYVTSGLPKTNNQNGIFIGKLPKDGSKTGTYSIGGGNLIYTTSSYTDAAGSWTATASSVTNGTSSMTDTADSQTTSDLTGTTYSTITL